MSDLVGNPDCWFSHAKAQIFRCDTGSCIVMKPGPGYKLIEPRGKNTDPPGFQPRPTQTKLYSYRMKFQI